MAKRKTQTNIGDEVKFAVEYPIFHIAVGQTATVRELLGETHANVFVPVGGSGIIIAVPLSDFEDVPEVTPNTDL